MRLLCAFVLLAALIPPPVTACGNKFLACGPGGQSSHIHIAAHPASILLYRNPMIPRTNEILNEDFEFALNLAGHSVDSVDTAQGLADALSEGKYNVVLADISDIALLSPAEDTLVIPVADADMAIDEAMANSYPLVVTASLSINDILPAIDAGTVPNRN